jgi:DNA-binding GntR family transcriptional regulator
LDTILNKLISRKTYQKNSISVRERAYEFLKSSVLSGHFNPGERLTEEHLAKKLGVSRTPVREALHKLESEGLIKPLETRGFIVSADSKEELEELFDIRTSLEGYALRLISQIISEETLKRMDKLILKAEHALKQRNIEEIFKWNTQFHDMLHDLIAHKPRIYSMITNVRKYVLRYRKDTLHYLDGAKRTIDGHRKIMLALRLKDPDLCERMMREHIHEAKVDAEQSLFEKTQEGVSDKIRS